MHGFPPDAIGGTELHVRALALAQAATHDVGVLARTRREDRADLRLVGEAVDGPVRVFGFNHLDRSGRSFLERTRFAPAEAAFGTVLAAFRPDVVHVHHLAGSSAGILGLAAERGARVVLSVHDHALACPRGQRIRLDLDPCPVLDRSRCVRCVRPAWIEAARSPERGRALLGLLRPGEGRRLFGARDAHIRANLDAVSAFIAPSASAADLFLEYYPAGRARMRIIPHGLPTEVGRTHQEGRPAGDFVAGYFGALLPSKGIGLLADVARSLAGDRIGIVAHGPVAPALRERLRARSADRLAMPGAYRPEDLGALMAAADAVLVPSLWPETFSIVVREAWAHGKPVLASETGALVEAAGPDRRRLGLVRPGDAGAWVAAIRRLATDPAWRAQLTGPHEPESFEAMLSATAACYMGSA